MLEQLRNSVINLQLFRTSHYITSRFCFGPYSRSHNPRNSVDYSLFTDDLLSGAFAHSLSNGSVASFGSSTPFGSVIEAAAQGSQSLGRLSFAMKEHSPSRENLLDRDLTVS